MCRRFGSFSIKCNDFKRSSGAGCQEQTGHSRTSLGELEVEPAVGSEIDAVDIIAALKRFGYSDLTGRQIKALVTTDRRVVYAEDYYGDGTWWEVGAVKGHVPVYGLRLKEDDAA